MARERWFYAREMRRVGPLPKHRLVESLLALPDARACLIWRPGLPAWTPSRDVPEIDRQLAPFVKAATVPAPGPGLAAATSLGVVGAEPAPAPGIPAPTRTSARQPARGVERPPAPNVALYLGGLAALLAVVVVGWLLWPRSSENQGLEPRPGGGAAKSGGPPFASPAAGGGPASEKGPGARTPGFAGWSDEEADLPLAELRRLRGVGGWTGDRLTITLYNGSTWRVTEILVRTSRLRGDQFVDGATPHRLLPAAGAPMDAATAELLKKVVPDRKKPGVNPLDTGPFEATVEPQPEAYRWRIEAARGYPPRS